MNPHRICIAGEHFITARSGILASRASFQQLGSGILFVSGHHQYIQKYTTALISSIDLERFKQFYGELGARLDRRESALECPEPPSLASRLRVIFLHIVSPLLFFMPYMYMKELDKLYVDRTIHYYFWRQFISGLKSDWESSITPVRAARLALAHPLNSRSC